VKYSRLRCSLEDRHRLACFLGVFATGCEIDFATPLIGPAWRDPAADRDAARRVTCSSLWEVCNIDALPDHQRNVEVVCLKKVGSLSRHPPYSVPITEGDSLEDQVGRILERHPVMLHKEASRYADAVVSRLFSGKKLRPASLVDAALSFQKTNLGFPRFSSKRSYLPEYFSESQWVCDTGFPEQEAWRYPGVIGKRSVSRGPYQYAKTRFVTQWSRVISNIEKSLYIPIFGALSRLPQFCAWGGPEAVNLGVTHFINESDVPILSLDFSGFDASVPFEVIDRVFTILQSWFESEARPMWRWVHTAFKRSGLLVPGRFIDGSERMRGVPSGSVLTNLIDSLVNMWVMAYSAHRNGARIRLCLVQGDDGVYTFSGGPTVKGIATVLWDELGMVLSTDPSKSSYEKKMVVYLQNYHRTDYLRRGLYVGVRPIMRAVCNMLGFERAPQEKEGWSRKYNTYRWLQQANNAADHPRFAEFCMWLWANDPYLKEAIDKIVAGDREVSLANSLLDVGSGERGKLPVSQLLWSPVVKTLRAFTAPIKV